MNILALWSGIIPLLTLLSSFHPIHVSVTEIEFDRKDRALEIMMRVFVDDLELTLKNTFGKPNLDVLKPGKDINLDELIEQYLKQHFKISLDRRPQKAKYLGHEREGEAFIFYIEITEVSEWKTISIFNDVIMETYDDQSNIVHVYIGDQVKSVRLTTDTPSDDLTFD